MAFEYKLTTTGPLDTVRHELYKDINFDKYFSDLRIRVSDTVLSYFDVTKEHYHFLAAVSTMIENGSIIDTGTHRGGSAVALSFNQSNKVDTYDIEAYKLGIKGNVKNTDAFFVDINHEGPDEIKLFDFLFENNYKGILILDDIHINNEMKQVWSYIQSKDVVTLDVTNIAHLLDGDGTGVVFFDKTHKCIDEIKSMLRDA